MKTIIPINGLDVEFSDQKPTRPCACYQFRLGWSEPKLISVRRLHRGILIGGGSSLEDYDENFVWSAPLVPAVEVEKAWQEGAKHGDQSRLLYERGGPNVTDADGYAQSRARRVVEGVS